MLKVRYTAWDGTQKVRLNAEQVFEKFSEYLSYTDDVQQALDWLLRQGLETDGIRILGGVESPGFIAAATEFVLEGLHLHQRLNKEQEGGRFTYRA